jgi:hypothetical protein
MPSTWFTSRETGSIPNASPNNLGHELLKISGVRPCVFHGFVDVFVSQNLATNAQTAIKLL